MSEHINLTVTSGHARKRHKPNETLTPLIRTADLRRWSSNLPAHAESRVFTLRATFGEPPNTLSSFIRSRPKEELQNIMREYGFAASDITGTKAQLLEKLRTEKPVVTYKIDSRECLQRVLVVVLDVWQFSPEHAFTVSMPRRGKHPLGIRRIDELKWMNFFHFSTDDSVDFAASPETESFVRAQVMCGGDETTVRAILSEDITTHDLAPYRVVEGRANSYLNMYEDTLDRLHDTEAGLEPGDKLSSGDGPDVNQQTDMIEAMTLMAGGALSLDDVCLELGDVLKFHYRREHFIYIEVVHIEEGADLLREEPFDHDLRERLKGNYPQDIHVVATRNISGTICGHSDGDGDNKDSNGVTEQLSPHSAPITFGPLPVPSAEEVEQLEDTWLHDMQRDYMARAAVLTVSDLKPPRIPALMY